MSDYIEDTIRAIMRNRRSLRPIAEKVKTHQKLIKELQEKINLRKQKLIDDAFEERTVKPITDPISEMRQAVDDCDIDQIKSIGVYAYEIENYSALRIGALIDPEIAELIEFLEAYGTLANENQRMFLRVILAAPEAAE